MLAVTSTKLVDAQLSSAQLCKLRDKTAHAIVYLVYDVGVHLLFFPAGTHHLIIVYIYKLYA